MTKEDKAAWIGFAGAVLGPLLGAVVVAFTAVSQAVPLIQDARVTAIDLAVTPSDLAATDSGTDLSATDSSIDLSVTDSSIDLSVTDSELSITDSMHLVGTNVGNTAGLILDEATLSLDDEAYPVELRPRPNRQSKMTLGAGESFEYVIGNAPTSQMDVGRTYTCVLSYWWRQLPRGEPEPRELPPFDCRRTR